MESVNWTPSVTPMTDVSVICHTLSPLTADTPSNHSPALEELMKHPTRLHWDLFWTSRPAGLMPEESAVRDVFWIVHELWSTVRTPNITAWPK